MRIIGLLLAWLSAAWPMGAYADRCQTDLPVSVSVPASASLVASDAPGVVRVTSEDLQRGHKTLHVLYQLEGNSPTGYLLSIDPRVGATEGLQIDGLPGVVTMMRDSVTVALPPEARGTELDLTVRWQLAPDATTGTYPLPIRLDVRPIGED